MCIIYMHVHLEERRGCQLPGTGVTRGVSTRYTHEQEPVLCRSSAHSYPPLQPLITLFLIN